MSVLSRLRVASRLSTWLRQPKSRGYGSAAAAQLDYDYYYTVMFTETSRVETCIFLDEEFNAKIGNFGMAKCVLDGSENQESYRGHPAGWNRGYLAPEYLNDGTISPSTDIFAYGVVLLEVLSGKTAITSSDDVKEGNFVKLSDEIEVILQSEDADDLKEWIDGSLGEQYSFDEAVLLANLARSCVEDEPSSRPNAGEIVEKLLRLMEDLPHCRDQLDICESSCKPLCQGRRCN